MRNKECDINELWTKIYEADQLNNTMCCSVGNDQKKFAEKVGLFSSHAYTLIGAYDCGKNIRLLKIRNPHGANEWTGKWND